MNVTLAASVQTLASATDGTAHNRNMAGLTDWVTGTNLAYRITSDNYTDVKRIPAEVNTLVKLREHIDTLHAAIAAGKKEDLQKNGTLRSYKVIVCCVHMLAVATAADNAWVVTHENHSLNQIAEETMAYAAANPPADIGRDASTLWKKTCDDTNLRVKNLLIAILQMCPTNAAGA
jgi:hypothetical protein